MGKWSKMMKSGFYAHHFHGPHGPHGPHRHHIWGESPRHHDWNDDSSSSSSDGEQWSGHKKNPKKHMKRHMKRMHKLRHLMRDLNTTEIDVGNNDNKAICSLCCYQIKPLVETEILECGHIYHRLCLGELFNLSLRQENKVFCTRCKHEISAQLIDTFKTRLAIQLSVQDQSGQQSAMNTEA